VGEEWSKVAPRVRVVTPVRVDPTGRRGPTKGQAQGSAWRRTSEGLYVPAEVGPASVEQRVVEQGVRLRRGAVTGWAALRLLGGGYFDGLDRDGRTPLPVTIAANGDRLRSGSGVDVRRVAIEESEVVVRYGVRCAAPERALFDAVRWAETLEDRVVAIDMAAAGELTSLRRLTSYTRTRRHVQGRVLVIQALWWADERADSPQEVRLRLIWRRRFSWPPPLVNHTVLDLSGRRLGTPDLVSVDLGMGAEYDGAEHRRRGRHRRDVRRLDDFQRAGLEIATFVGEDLDDEELVVDRLRATARRAGRLPRRWTVAPPGHSLDERLDHRDHMIALAEAGDANV
jgi:hypothetical protein